MSERVGFFRFGSEDVAEEEGDASSFDEETDAAVDELRGVVAQMGGGSRTAPGYRTQVAGATALAEEVEMKEY